MSPLSTSPLPNRDIDVAQVIAAQAPPLSDAARVRLALLLKPSASVR